MKPLIGISPTPAESTLPHGHFRRYGLSDTYTRSVLAAGGIPVILSAHPDSIDDVLDHLDGIIFSGGGDIDSSYWNEERHERASGFDEERDEFELRAIPKVVARDMPMLGICRGLQTVNVAMGGTIVQDIPDQLPGTLQHRQHEDGKMRNDTSHTVTVRQGDNPLYQALGKTSVETNSFHHQSVKDLGHGLEIIATAEDGVVEAVWNPSMTFGLAVQWHPEMLAAEYPEHAAIFKAFIAATAEKKSAG